MNVAYPCCQHCWHYAHNEPIDRHPSPCLRCPSADLPADPYVEEADANPERRSNGCMIYRVGP